MGIIEKKYKDKKNHYSMKSIPKSLRIWFLIHFIVDLLFAIPLIFFPITFLSLLGFTIIDPITARLVGAALIGIGGASFFAYKKTKKTYDILLTLKIIWSISAIFTLAWAIIEGSPKIVWLILITFMLFSGVWIYSKLKLRKN